MPAWSVVPPNNPAAVEFLAEALIDSNYHMETVLRKLFHSDFFKEARFTRVKNPTEVVISTLRLVGNSDLPSPDILDWTGQIVYMGQDLMNPPSVEGWHSGIEWINSGTLMKRTNFMSEMIGDYSRPGVKKIIDRVSSESTTPEDVVDSCLNIIGPLAVTSKTRSELVEHVSQQGDFEWNSDGVTRALELLQLIVATREFQFA